MTVKNPELVNIKDNIGSLAYELLFVSFRRCVNETQSVVCASDVDFKEHIGKYNVMLMSMINFIEYEEVEPGVGPVKRTLRTISYEPLSQDLSLSIYKMSSFIEHQISLEDCQL